MSPTAPSANPTTSNTNQPYGGFGQAQSDYSKAGNILSYLPTQEAQTTAAATNANTNTGSILPNISTPAANYVSPTAQVVNAGNYGTNLTGYNAAVQGAMSNLTGQENTTYQNALNALTNTESQYGNLTPVYQKLASEYNIPGYQNDVANLTGLLQNLTRDVNAQTTLGGGLMTESARDEMYANQAQPLQTALNSASEFLNYGQNDVSNLLDTYQKSLTNALTPLQTNISNLPTLFGQTNEAAQTGYGQGATAIENTIQNQQEAQRIAIERANLALQQKEYNANYGNGGSLASAIQNGTLKGIANTAPAKGSTGGYNFNVSGAPVSAATWASVNNVPINALLAYMAQGGDRQALNAMNDVNAAGQVTPEIESKYPSLFPRVSAAPVANNNVNILSNLVSQPFQGVNSSNFNTQNVIGAAGNLIGDTVNPLFGAGLGALLGGM